MFQLVRLAAYAALGYYVYEWMTGGIHPAARPPVYPLISVQRRPGRIPISGGDEPRHPVAVWNASNDPIIPMPRDPEVLLYH